MHNGALDLVAFQGVGCVQLGLGHMGPDNPRALVLDPI